jgi:hypothetical protein
MNDHRKRAQDNSTASPEQILAGLKYSRKARSSIMSAHPNLALVYDSLENRLFSIAATSATFLPHAASFLIRAVATRFAVPILINFLNDGMREERANDQEEAIAAAVASALANYVVGFSPDERDIYFNLQSEEEQNVFRICRDLAGLPNRPAGPGTFFLSSRQLGDRLGIDPMAAHRILGRFSARYRILELVSKGTKWQAGERRTATVWKWHLSIRQIE